MKRSIAILMAGGLAVFAAPGGAGAETVLTYSSWLPWTHPVNTAIYIPWMEKVEKATNGRVKFRRLPKAVASPRAHLDAVRTGQADAGMSVHDYSPRRFAAYQFSQLPFLGDKAIHTSVAMWRTHEKFFASKKFYKGVHLIGMNTHGPGMFHHSKKFILTPADMKGQKIRTGGPIPRNIVKAWGGVPVRQPAPKSYELLSTGVVDGITFPWESLPSFKITKLVPYSTYIPGGLYSSSHYLVMSESKWKKLSAADKKAIASLSGEAFARHAGGGWDKINDHGKKVALAAGNKLKIAPASLVAAVRKLSVAFEKDYIKGASKAGIDGATVLNYFKGEVAKLSGK